MPFWPFALLIGWGAHRAEAHFTARYLVESGALKAREPIMTGYLLIKLAGFAATLIAASVVVFCAARVLPGDPAVYMLGMNADPQTVEALRAGLGLDRPAFMRYLGWVAGMLQGDFGLSYTYRIPVGHIIAERLAVSAPLALYALFLTLALSFPVAMAASARRGKALDLAVTGASQIGIAVPNFWFAMILILIFAVGLGWFPAGGFAGWNDGLVAGLQGLTLPAIALALPQAAILARVLRGALIDALSQDYIRTARSKGLSLRAALRNHALRNAMIPALTIIGLQFSFLLAGAVIVENVFFLPGLGRLLLQAIAQRDLIVVEGVLMLLVGTVVFVNFLVDLGYALIDPRLRAGYRDA